MGSAEQAITSTNRLSMNRLSMNRLSMNGLSLKRLSPDRINLSSTGLVLDAEGIDLLRYIVGCALPEDRTLVATVGTVTHTFRGLIGLAPQWLDTPLSGSGQRWVSACLLAHANGYGISVPISLRGRHTVLMADVNERIAFPKEEMSFFGNVFISPEGDDDVSDVYACGSPSLEQTCGAVTGAFAPARSCAAAEGCGLTFVGACRNEMIWRTQVCSRVDFYGYAECKARSLSDDNDDDGTQAYNEVVTVFLQQNDLSYFYPSCVSSLL